MRTTYNSYVEMPDGIKIALMISLPSNYDEKKKYPLTVFLHGNGEFHQGYPNISAMYVQGITKEIKEGRRKDYESIVVAIQGHSTNKSWWVEQIEYVIALLFGDIKPKANHRTDVQGSFKALEGIKKYNLYNEIDFMCISQGGQGFSDWLKRYNRIVGTVTLVCAYVTLKATDAAFKRIKKGVEIYHSINDSVGIWGAEQLANKAKETGLNNKKTIYPGSSHAIWHTTFADDELYNFHTKAFPIHDEETPTPPVTETPPPVIPPVEEKPPVAEVPPVAETPQFLDLNAEMFSSDKDIKDVVKAILEEKEPPVKWNETDPYTMKIDLGKVFDVTKVLVKDGQGTCPKPNHTIFKTDKGVIMGEFTGGKYNAWDQLSGAHKTRYILIENIISTKKNLPIGLKIEVLK
jgi:hypothetical protein